ncbi:Gfo/Idh/MocA family oxidoreductase [Klugiella xanthotipulae]|uniref:Putative dehydrogenase n=1 Tax=Klugiella xanthotipulae TaxID=244735 RepID=A0A543HYW0_9MICO|nr:Gfo/Idh/MocA family oxidoreductase [Klugiella xanthotipulae]TQM63524.1 putative dehydrogenase [Klugiella xanthotipulae]
MSRTIRWGVLAPGGIARIVVADLIAEGLVVHAVGSRDAERARAFAREFGIPATHGNYADLVADPDVDVVYIASPYPFHHEHALLALRAGKHILVEKPFALNAAQAAEVVEVARERSLLVVEAMWTRFLPHMARIREIIASGMIGDVHTLMADHTQALSADPEHRINNLALGGGALLDLGVYPVSCAHDLFGEPDTVQATAIFKETGADAQVATILGYQDGRIATSLSASDTRGPNRASILGTEGRIEIEGVWYQPTGFTVYDREDREIDKFISLVTGTGRGLQAVEVTRLIEAGETECELITPGESIAVMRTLDRVRAEVGLVYPGE